MQALCLITVKPGKIDEVIRALKKRHRASKEVLPVTGRADICVLLNGSIEQINDTVISFKRVADVATTETLIEVEVNMGW